MDDKNLKNFLNKNSKIPERPAGEWSNILMKIESQSSSQGVLSNVFGIRKIIIGLTGFAALVIITLNIDKPYQVQHTEASLKDLDTFLVADSYFHESESDYSWVVD